MARPKGFRISQTAWSDLLAARGTTITEVAELSGVNRATISGIVGGHARASMPIARRLADALNVDPATLFPTIRAAVFAEVAA